MNSIAYQVFDSLLQHFGRQHWWPAQSATEVIVGAVLTQNTSWKNVELAIKNLREQDLLRIDRLAAMPIDELAQLIRPAGYFRLKAKRLNNLVMMIQQEFAGSVAQLLSLDTDALREQLLDVNGIGPETADSIVLYGAGKATFVIDTYTARVFKRHGWVEPEADYYALKGYFENELAEDVALYNEYHALLVRVGNQYCRKTPKCDECPLKDMLPAGGPIES